MILKRFREYQSGADNREVFKTFSTSGRRHYQEGLALFEVLPVKLQSVADIPRVHGTRAEQVHVHSARLCVPHAAYLSKLNFYPWTNNAKIK